MATTSTCVVLAGRTSNGFCLQIKGSGTMVYSTAVQEFVAQSFTNGAESIVLDLSGCTYLDSTFLGTLVNMHRQWNKNGQKRFVVAASESKVKDLLHAARVDSILPMVAEVPQCVGECMPIAVTNAAAKAAFARHIMECHQHLAEIEGPNQAKFAMIAKHMADELEHAAK